MPVNLTDTWTDWTAVSSFTNSWVNVGSGNANAAYRKTLDGKMVQLVGIIQSGASGTSAFTLPTGYRPLTQRNVITANVSSQGTVYVQIAANGNVTLYGGISGDSRSIHCSFAIDI